MTELVATGFLAEGVSGAGGTGPVFLRVMPLLAIVLGALLVTDFKGSATRLYGLLARYQRPGMATVGTVRTVGGIAIFVGVGSLAPDLVALLT